MEHDQEIFRLIPRREAEGEPLNCDDLAAWYGEDKIRYNALIEDIGKELLLWEQRDRPYVDPDDGDWRNVKWEPIEPSLLFDICDQVTEEFNISTQHHRFKQYMAEKLLSGDHITVEPHIFRKWIIKNFPPTGPVERLGKVSDLLRVLDVTYHALYVESEPPEDATCYTEKARIEDWLESNYKIILKNLEYIARILNPFPFPRKSAPPVKKEK